MKVYDWLHYHFYEKHTTQCKADLQNVYDGVVQRRNEILGKTFPEPERPKWFRFILRYQLHRKRQKRLLEIRTRLGKK